MRIRLLSDLHTEFDDHCYDPGWVDCDVVVLAGDIGVGIEGIRWAKETFPDCPVLYLMGNHEYYGYEYFALLERARRFADGSNVRVLENESCVIGGVRFLGCTLWSNFNLYPGMQRISMEMSARYISDYRYIRRNPLEALQPPDTLRFHNASIEWMQSELSRPFKGKTVVLSHHSPTPLGSDPKFDGDDLTPYFCSDLRHLLRPPVDLWLFGHTHWCMDQIAGTHGTRVVANQRGYRVAGRAESAAFDPLKIIEIQEQS